MSLTSEQHKLREKGIGGSEAYIACGFSAFGRTPVSLWAEKTGRKLRDEIPEANRERVDIGNKIEDMIANLYSERVDKPVRRSRKDYRHKEQTYMRTYVDRLVEGTDIILECKNVDSFMFDRGEWGEPGTDNVPLNYYFQCQHMLIVTGRERCDVAALVGGNKLVVYHIEAEADIHKMIMRNEAYFWDCVEANQPPEIMTAEDISYLYPCEDGALPPRIADAETFRALERLKFHKAQVKKHTDARDELALEIKKYMADSAVLLDLHGMELATFKKNKPSNVTDYQAAFESLLDYIELQGFTDRDELRKEYIAAFTEEKPGNRPLLTKSGEKAWTG